MEKFQTNSITAIVLAGGQSSRMGRDKALIEIQGQSLLQRICILARECAHQVYVITAWPERYQLIVPAECILLQERFLLGGTTPHGPLLAFAQGLAAVQTEWILLLACDLPRLTASEVKNWSEYLVKVERDAIALLPRSSKGWEPLCGFYRLSCLPLLNEFIKGGGRSFQHWLTQYPIQELPINDPGLLLNCNTITDLEKIIELSL
jgi:molybdopterin-guanine dinucleotide biosynthesis protein A